MARRSRSGPEYLVRDERTGFVHYSDEVVRDWNGVIVRRGTEDGEHPLMFFDRVSQYLYDEQPIEYPSRISIFDCPVVQYNWGDVGMPPSTLIDGRWLDEPKGCGYDWGSIEDVAATDRLCPLIATENGSVAFAPTFTVDAGSIADTAQCGFQWGTLEGAFTALPLDYWLIAASIDLALEYGSITKGAAYSYVYGNILDNTPNDFGSITNTVDKIILGETINTESDYVLDWGSV